MFEKLAHMLHDLPMKATSYTTLEELGYDPNTCANAVAAEGDIKGYISMTNSAAKRMVNDGEFTIETMQKYAVDRFSDFQSYFHLRHHLEKCGVDPTGIEPSLTEEGRKLVDTAYELYQQEGIEVPFTGEPILDVLIAGSIVVGSTIGVTKLRGKVANLFYSYKL